MLRVCTRAIFLIVLLFVLPSLISLAVWQSRSDQPANWHSANWDTANILPSDPSISEAAVYVMAARTGRWKGAFSIHSWIVLKREGDRQYNRYDKVGWGNPIRQNAYAADANWYSNPPQIIKSFHGEEAKELIPKIEAAITGYPFSERGEYNIWPGPNSNSFVAFVLNEVPEMKTVLPANAVGRDFPMHNSFFKIDPDWSNFQITYNGYLGFAIGRRSGIEFQMMGLVTGFDFSEPGLKLPGFGTLKF